MSNLNELLQDYVNLSYENLLSLANLSMQKTANELKDILGENTSRAYLIVIAACLGTDNKLTELEYKFLKDFLEEEDMTFEEAKNLLETISGSEAMELTDNLVDVLSPDGKSALIMFCLSFLAVDETISVDEVDFIKKLLA